jgi:hypothetical protein
MASAPGLISTAVAARRDGSLPSDRQSGLSWLMGSWDAGAPLKRQIVTDLALGHEHPCQDRPRMSREASPLPGSARFCTVIGRSLQMHLPK